MGSPSPFFAFWETALRLFAWGLLALGFAWVGDEFAGKKHHPNFLRLGAIVVVLSGIAMGWWRAGPAEGAAAWYTSSVQLMWTAGTASLVFVLAQGLDYPKGLLLPRVGIGTVLGVAVIVAGIGMGIWANYFHLGEHLSQVGRGVHWLLFWSGFHLAGLFGALTVGFSEVIRGVAACKTLSQDSSLERTLPSFAFVGRSVAVLFFAASLGVGVWQAMGSASPFPAFLKAAFDLFVWGLLILGLAWIGDTLGGRRHHPDFLRIGAVLQIVCAVWVAGEARPLDDAHAWSLFSASVVQGIGTASLILVLAQLLDWARGRPLARIGLLRMIGVAVVAAAIGIGIWSAYLFSESSFVPDEVRNLYWWDFWAVFGMPALFGVLTIGLAEVAQGLAVWREMAHSEPEGVEPQAAL